MTAKKTAPKKTAPTKATPAKKAPKAEKAQTTQKTEKKGPFKQPLQKPQPWSFGGRDLRADRGEGNRAQPDAERLAGKSRKVH